ncbi:MAG: S8 family serine peptidase [Gemmatimonadaceae bacterium]|nr:S8 family serine peptidase [Gemmatimonadaceae bacterium]
MARRVYREETVRSVLDALAAGGSIADVASATGVPESTVRRWRAEMVAAATPTLIEAVGRVLEAIVGRQRPGRSSGPAGVRGANGGTSEGGDAVSGAHFAEQDLDRSAIALPLLDAMHAERQKRALPAHVLRDGDQFSVMIDLNQQFAEGRERARARVQEIIESVVAAMPGSEEHAPHPALPERLWNAARNYIFAWLTARQIQEVVRQDSADGWEQRAIFRIWPNHPVETLLDRSVRTIKGDAAVNAFGADGAGITWAVIDSGVRDDHPHFATHGNLQLPTGVTHQDFTDAEVASPLTDEHGHGTHVAGIISGCWPEAEQAFGAPRALTWRRDEGNRRVASGVEVKGIRGVAPATTIVSYKVVDAHGRSDASRVIAALDHIASVNDDGPMLRIHGVNLSLGYPFDPEWYACGHSLLCVAVNRLVKSGVVVVCAAGNSGYGVLEADDGGARRQGLLMSIHDPGNAEFALTVGSTHRDEPHRYGASYFSSKGPTGDGRAKPDLVAPGEKIRSANAQFDQAAAEGSEGQFPYIEKSGTSAAAPHVSGAIAAFLSVRREFIGRSEFVKELFMRTATDLQRDRHLQGAGLVDLTRALHAV